jgi:ABC-type Na+ transport system ATPase subunit NatA
MDIVAKLCERVVILHRGHVVAEGTPQELEARRHSDSLEEVFALVTEQEDYAERAVKLLDLLQQQ